jgi:hypothetical protein
MDSFSGLLWTHAPAGIPRCSRPWAKRRLSLRPNASSRLAAPRRFDGIDGNLRRLNVGFARMEGDMAEVKDKLGDLLGLKSEFSLFKTFLERMNGNVEAFLRKSDLQGSMLMDHEGRIKNLESLHS